MGTFGGIAKGTHLCRSVGVNKSTVTSTNDLNLTLASDLAKTCSTYSLRTCWTKNQQYKLVVLPTKLIKQLSLTDFSPMSVTGICQRSLAEICSCIYSLAGLAELRLSWG
jgi:hypothetical protein